MTVSELFRRHSFADIELAFQHIFCVNNRHICSERELKEWKRLYDHWAMLQPSPTTRHIRLVSRWENCSPMIDMNFSVCDSSGNIIAPLAAYQHESEVLGMTVTVEDEVEITEAELAAGLFWEMTYKKIEGWKNGNIEELRCL